MKPSIPAVFIVLLALGAALAACSSTIPGGIPTSGTTAIADRAANARANVRPGETLDYAIFISGTSYSWNGPTASPIPSPYSGTTSSTVSYGYDAKTNVYTSTLSEGQYTQTSSFGFAPSAGGGRREILYSYTYQQVPGSGTTFYPAGKVEAVLPFEAGATWNDAAGTIETGQEDLVTTTSTIAVDGSYRSHSYGVIEKPIVVDAVVNPDGTGSYSSQQPSQTATGWTIGHPVLHDGAWRIDGTTTNARNFPAKPAKPEPFHLIDWYPNHAAPSPLLSDRSKVVGSVTTPKSCKAQSGLPAKETIETSSFLDPLAMYDQSIVQTNYYGTGGYAICEIVASTTTDHVLFAPDPAEDGFTVYRNVETDTWVLENPPGGRAGAVPPALRELPYHPLEAGFALRHRARGR